MFFGKVYDYIRNTESCSKFAKLTDESPPIKVSLTWYIIFIVSRRMYQHCINNIPSGIPTEEIVHKWGFGEVSDK